MFYACMAFILSLMVIFFLITSSTGSVHATSIAASRVEQALSEVASSLQSSAPKQGPLHPWMTLAQIWLHAGTVKVKFFLLFLLPFLDSLRTWKNLFVSFRIYYWSSDQTFSRCVCGTEASQEIKSTLELLVCKIVYVR